MTAQHHRWVNSEHWTASQAEKSVRCIGVSLFSKHQSYSDPCE